MKSGIPVVLGPRTPFIPRRAPCHEVQGDFSTTELENRAIAKKGIEVLRIPFHPESLEASLPCRMEKFRFEGVDIILDVAHNPDGLFQLFNTLKGTPLRVVFGMSKSKDLPKCAEIIKKGTRHIHLVEVPDGRGYPMNELENAFLPVKTEIAGSIQEGVYRAINIAKKTGETVLVCGSCYIMGDARNLLTSSLTCSKV